VPFLPTSPIFSPGLICQEAFLYRYLPANSKLKSFRANTPQSSALPQEKPRMQEEMAAL
jgi:hypothetical protein